MNLLSIEITIQSYFRLVYYVLVYLVVEILNILSTGAYDGSIELSFKNNVFIIG